ncbi:SpoIIIAH-like family protein [Heliorestis convoluta]|uniref:SpoIIIAH-like family protein n=1 Tax=Heliorestis convoluta TaxID=356322 RepID=A0A5Q2N1Y8_9FIRM|nr:SpoIIIAH-like family protein [Heliorestis convoluta]QGG46555.1 SpoIIIAH-like family protein [Heliorestis convoluta]
MEKQSFSSKSGSNFKKSSATKRSPIPPRFFLLVIGLTALLLVGLSFKSSHLLGDKAFTYVLQKMDTIEGIELEEKIEASPESSVAATVVEDLPFAHEDVANPWMELQKNIENNNFFSEYRMERERTRSQQIELLREITNNSRSGETTRQEAQQKLLYLTELMRKELETEKILIAQGYDDAVVVIQPGSVSVVISGDNLTKDSKKGVIETVSSITGASTTSISLMVQ